MANYIPESTISEVKNAAEILDIVSDVVVLKKTGRNYVGLCPFHSEKTPSFTVSPDKQIFHCFGCGVGGNVFSFMMKHDNLSFPEAVRMLAGRYGIVVPDRQLSPQQKKQLREKETLYAINRHALTFYNKCLFEHRDGKQALVYLKNRQIDLQTIERFQLGFAPIGWDHLYHYLIRRRYSRAMIEKCGLAIPRKHRSGCYDRFRNRLIFPIFDTHQQHIGFGGRVLDDSLPKYLNSPETPIYHKNRSLYGITLAKNKCRESKSVYIVEGYFDVLTLHQQGIQNSVATLGTAVTSQHVRVLKGLIGDNGTVFLVFDSDTAGIKAAIRSIDLFHKEFVDVKILVLDQGHDPDSYLRQYGSQKFLERSSQALGIVLFLLNVFIKKHGLSVEGKIRILADIQQPLVAVRDPVVRSLYVKEISEQLGVDEHVILDKIKTTQSQLNHRERRNQRNLHTPESRSIPQTSIDQLAQTIDMPNESRIERQLIAMMIQFPVALPLIREKKLLDYFKNDLLKSIGEKLLAYYQQMSQESIPIPAPNDKTATQSWMASFVRFANDVQEESIITALALEDMSWDDKGCEQLIHQFITSATYRQDKLEIEAQIKQAELENNEQLLIELLAKRQKLAESSEKRKMALVTGQLNQP